MAAISVVRAIKLNCDDAVAIAAVQDIWAIERTEVKADRVRVAPASATDGTYEVDGRFAGVRWSSRFAYRLHESGFHSEKLPGERPTGWGISGGFAAAPAGPGRCVVTHYEDYDLPQYLAPLRAPIRLYLRWSMGVELRRLRDLIAS